MKKFFVAILLTVFLVPSYAQINYHIVDNYNASPIMTLNSANTSWYYWNEYGEEILFNQRLNVSQKWMGQEVDLQLNLVFFPSRTYSPLSKRFLQPDPKSQYFSPYLYVNSDPINNVDRDGKEGKPLILYELEYTEQGKFTERTMDIMSEFGDDAHYMSLSGFFNGRPIDLPNWNGNVFIDAHMHYAHRNNLELERSKDKLKLTTLDSEATNLVTVPQLPGEYFVSTDASKIGEKLAEYSMKNRTPVKNIFVGGCEGGAPAEDIKNGFVQKIKPFEASQEVNAFGLKEGFESLIAGKVSTSASGTVSGYNELRFYPVNSFAKVQPELRQDPNNRFKQELVGYKREELYSKQMKDMHYLDASSIRSAVNEEMAPEHRAFFEFHSAVY